MSQPADAASRPLRADPLGSALARAAFEASTECVIVLDPNGTVIAVNRAFCELYGIDAVSTVGEHYMGFSKDFEIRRFGDPLDPRNWVTARALNAEPVRGVMQGVRNRVTGREFFGRYGATPVLEDDRFVATVITVLDVTESTRAAQALDAALSAAEVGTWRADILDGKVWADANYARICGLSEEEVTGGSLARLYDLIHPDDRERVLRAFRLATVAGAPHEVEYRIVLEDGTVRWLVSRGMVALSQAGEPSERVGSIMDVTVRKEAEEEIARRESFVRATIDALPQIAWSAGPDMAPTYANARWAEYTGLPEATIAAADASIHPDEVGIMARLAVESQRSGKGFEGEVRLRRRDGAYRWHLVRVEPRRADEEVVGWVGTMVDVHDLRTADERLASATDAVPAFIAFMDCDLTYRFCNRRFEQWFGRPRSEIVGRHIREIVGEAVFTQLQPYLTQALAGEGTTYAQWLDFPQGRRFMRASYIPSFDAEGNVDGLSAMIDDETEQRLTEERLRASEERFRLVVEAATVGVVVNDAEGRFLYANPPFLSMLGYAPADLEEGRLSWSLVQIPELRPRDDVALDQLRETGSCEPYETELLASDGRRVPVYVGAAFVPDDRGEGVMGAAFVTDLTPLKAAQEELQTLNRELDAKVRERTQELERANRDLNEFSYSVAHDLRAPLRAIVSTSRILLEDASERLLDEEKDLLLRQSTNAVRLARIVDDLLNFGRLAKADLRKEPFDLTKLARGVAEEVGNRWRNVCPIEVSEEMRAVGDASLVGYALINLLDNACKFSPSGGTITVGEEDGVFFVRDQGVGFDMSHAHKLFVAFERLVDQERFPGTGVGLANVKRIIERHGGQIWAESEPGCGATFWFTLGK